VFIRGATLLEHVVFDSPMQEFVLGRFKHYAFSHVVGQGMSAQSRFIEFGRVC
jgi:hypothetical protein